MDRNDQQNKNIDTGKYYSSSGEDYLTILPEDINENNGEIKFQLPKNWSSHVWGYKRSENWKNSHYESPLKTTKDYEEIIKNLRRDNFDLKLRIFLLEERCSKHSWSRKDENFDADHELQLDKYRKNLSRCFELVDEAVMTIDILENQLQDEKEKHREEVQILQQKISEVDHNVALSNEHLINNSIKPNKKKTGDLPEYIPTQPDTSPSQRVQDAYYSSVQLYRTVVDRLLGRVRWAREEWGELAKELRIRKEDEILQILESKNNIFAHIFDTENIYDEDEDVEDLSLWKL